MSKIDYNTPIALDFDDVLIVPSYSELISRAQVDLTRQFTFSNGLTWEGIPIIASNMDGVGTFEMALELSKVGMLTALVKHYDINDVLDFFKDNPKCLEYVMPSFGISEHDLNNLIFLMNNVKLKFIRLDVANGHMKIFHNRIKQISELYPELVMFAGNVANVLGSTYLRTNGAHVSVLGIGSGGQCTTRLKAGVGYPQFSLIDDVSSALNRLNINDHYITSDGGCKTPGDISKAFGAGADFVMLGSMLAGHDEGGGELIHVPNSDGSVSTYVEFYGMSSRKAMEKNYGEKADYRSSEGRVVHIPYRPSLKETINDILGGIRSTCTYVGASSIRELKDKVSFIRVNNTHNREYIKYEV